MRVPDARRVLVRHDDRVFDGQARRAAVAPEQRHGVQPELTRARLCSNRSIPSGVAQAATWLRNRPTRSITPLVDTARRRGMITVQPPHCATSRASGRSLAR